MREAEEPPLKLMPMKLPTRGSYCDCFFGFWFACMRKLFQFITPQNRCFKRQTVTDDSLKKSPDFFQFSRRHNHAKPLPAPGSG